MKKKLSFIIFGFALLLYANTLFNSYAIDDVDLILNNDQVKNGLSSLGDIFSSRLRDGSNAVKNELYRPITKLVYALEWSLSSNNPAVAHLFNIVLFAVLCLLVFWVADLLFPNNLAPAFLTALFFAAHPIHTEVVANIKSVDEILALMFFLTALLFLVKYFKSKSAKHLVFAVVLYGLALFSKESSVAFFFLIPLFIYYTTDAQPKLLFKTSLYFVVPLLIFLFARHHAMDGYDPSKMIGKIDNFLIAAHSPSQRLASCIYMLGAYIKLLFIPWPLVSDYSFHRFPFVSLGNIFTLSSVALVSYVIIFAFKNFKSRHLAAFSFIWFLVTIALASNIFYLIGTNFAERLLFAPSFGYCLFMSYCVLKLGKAIPCSSAGAMGFFEGRKWQLLILVPVVAIFGCLTFLRNSEWKNNGTLAAADVKKNPGSARLHFFLANELRNEIVDSKNAVVQNKNLPLIKAQLEEAIRIYPEYASARFALGEYFMHVDSARQALPQFQIALYYLPRSAKVYNAIAICLLKFKEYDSTMMYLRMGLAYNPQNPDLTSKYGAALLHKNKVDSAIFFLQQSLTILPKNAWALGKMAEAYELKQDTVKRDHYKKLELENKP